MTYKDPRLFHDVRTSKDFLLSQTEGASKLTKPSCKQKSISPDDRIQIMASYFPNVPVKEQLWEIAGPSLDSAENIIALVVKLDALQNPIDTPAELLDELQDNKAVGNAIDAFCKTEKALWGILDTNLFGCFFPGKTASFSETATHRIRMHLKKSSSRTVTIGITEYPLADFQKTAMLENACKALDHADFFGPGSTVTFDDVSLNISGDNLFQNGDVHAAINEFQTALLLNDTNTNVRNSLGVCYGLLGQFDDAVEAFKAATVADPDEFMTFYNLGLVYMIQEAHDKALACFSKADGLSEDVFEISIQTGRMYMTLGQPEKAIGFLEKATQLEPTSALGFRLLGDCLTELGRPPDALTAYKQAVKLHPNDACALSAMGALYESADRNIEIASLYCEKSVEISPSEGLFHTRLGRLYLKQNRLDDAAKSFQRADELGQNVQDLVAEIQQLKKVG